MDVDATAGGADPALDRRSRSSNGEVSLVKDTRRPGAARDFNAKAARAKLMSRAGAEAGSSRSGPGVATGDRAHDDDEMACFTCHLSWTTSCGGCHLPIEANWKTERHHYEGDETRNFATYNPQVARDDMFQLGRHRPPRATSIAPVRSTSALVLSLDQHQPRADLRPAAADLGDRLLSQAFAPHFPHTVRTTETKTCTDCHLSAGERQQRDHGAAAAARAPTS